MSDPEAVAAMVKGTPLAAYLDPGAPAQRAGILSSMNMVADSLELLPQYAEHKDPKFATSSWISTRKRWVFLTSSSGYREKLLPLHSVWLDLFILRMMGYCPDAQPVWFVLDELASLNKLPQLHTAVTETASMGTRSCWAFRAAVSWKSDTARMPKPCSRSPRPRYSSRPPSPARRNGFRKPSARSRSSG